MSLFFFTATAPTEIYTLSLHDALPIYVLALHPAADVRRAGGRLSGQRLGPSGGPAVLGDSPRPQHRRCGDRKSTRLNSSHVEISYAVFCLKKKKTKSNRTLIYNMIDYT